MVRTLTARGSLSGSPAVPPKDHMIVGAIDHNGLSQRATPCPAPLDTDSQCPAARLHPWWSVPYGSQSGTSGRNGCCPSVQTPVLGYRDQEDSGRRDSTRGVQWAFSSWPPGNRVPGDHLAKNSKWLSWQRLGSYKRTQEDNSVISGKQHKNKMKYNHDRKEKLKLWSWRTQWLNWRV